MKGASRIKSELEHAIRLLGMTDATCVERLDIIVEPSRLCIDIDCERNMLQATSSLVTGIAHSIETHTATVSLDRYEELVEKEKRLERILHHEPNTLVITLERYQELTRIENFVNEKIDELSYNKGENK